MVVLCTGGEDLEENDQTLDDYLCFDCQVLSTQEVLSPCDNHMVLFDNKLTDEYTSVGQMDQLMKLVIKVVSQNG
ncbi:Immune-associated nucleotide-binding protein 10 [Linum perenne]